ncbi:15143_t:CDS:2, partial [Acaulospora colombiana]
MVRSIGPRVHRKGSLYPELAAEQNSSHSRSLYKATKITNPDFKNYHSPYGFAVTKDQLKPQTEERIDPSYIIEPSKSNVVPEPTDSSTTLGEVIAETASGISSKIPIMSYNNPVAFIGAEQVQCSFVQMNYEPSYWAMPTLSYTDESYETQKTPL